MYFSGDDVAVLSSTHRHSCDDLKYGMLFRQENRARQLPEIGQLLHADLFTFSDFNPHPQRPCYPGPGGRHPATGYVADPELSPGSWWPPLAGGGRSSRLVRYSRFVPAVRTSSETEGP